MHICYFLGSTFLEVKILQSFIVPSFVAYPIVANFLYIDNAGRKSYGQTMLYAAEAPHSGNCTLNFASGRAFGGTAQLSCQNWQCSDGIAEYLLSCILYTYIEFSNLSIFY